MKFPLLSIPKHATPSCCDQDHEHLITGDLRIIQNKKTQETIK